MDVIATANQNNVSKATPAPFEVQGGGDIPARLYDEAEATPRDRRRGWWHATTVLAHQLRLGPPHRTLRTAAAQPAVGDALSRSAE
ncbi:MAG: hypothetical protein HYX34_15680 [Actinobacteria bacterium]|nr:hypothetical protein [Actinomycetota bacterium]